MPFWTTRRGSRSLQDSRLSLVTFLRSQRSSPHPRVPLKTDFSAPRRSLKITINLVSHPCPTTLRYGPLHTPISPTHERFQRLKNAMAFPFVHDGIPILYYGVPFPCRLTLVHCSWILRSGARLHRWTRSCEPRSVGTLRPTVSLILICFLLRLWLSGYAQDKDLVQFIKTLNGARKAAIASNNQFLSTAVSRCHFLGFLDADGCRVQMSFPLASQTTLAVSKSPMLALFTNIGASGSVSWNVPKSGYSGNTRLIDVVSCTVVTTNSDGSLAANTTNGLPQIYLPVSALSSSNKICAGKLGTGNSASGVAVASLMLVGFTGFAYLLMEVGF